MTKSLSLLGSIWESLGLFHEHIGHDLKAGRIFWIQGNQPIGMPGHFLHQLIAHVFPWLSVLLHQQQAS